MSATMEICTTYAQHAVGGPMNIAWTEPNNTALSLEPDAFDLTDMVRRSSLGFGGWVDLVRICPDNPQLTADPLPSLNRNFGKAIHVLVLATLASGTAIGSTWGTPHPLPSTVVGWDDAAQFLRGHPTMSSPDVSSYLQAVRGEDIDTIRTLYDRFTAAFSDALYMEASYRFSVDHDSETPRLFLTIDTHGMDLSEVMRREMAFHDLIEQDPVLKAATKNHIITAV